jgi:DNA-binding NtrC family response regulator
MTANIAPPVTDAVRVLIVDDDATNISILHQTLAGRGYQLLAARTGDDAIKIARRTQPALILLDIMMPGIDGFETCRRLRDDAQTRDAAVIFLSSLDDAKDKVRGLELGAVDFITKPFQGEEVIARVHTHLTIRRLQRELEARNAQLARDLQVAQELLTEARRRVDGPLLGGSPGVRALREEIARHAATTDSVLLTGPHGAGQEGVARAIHHESSRGGRAFIHVNCALLRESQQAGMFDERDTRALEESGSRVGADAPLSPVELAVGGTLYLDEVHRLPTDLQQRLADILQRIEHQRVTAAPVNPDVRLMAYTSLDPGASGILPALLRLIDTRLLRVPSLVERREDIPELAQFFARQHARRLGIVVEDIAEESMKRLKAYRWPGNVRELQSVVERATAAARGRVLEVDKNLLDEGLPLGHYRLLEKIGHGGMGEVWRATHQLLARPAAVKLIRTEMLEKGTREAAVGRFQLEARAIASLSSPNTVRLYDFGVSEAGEFYYVMELLNGMDLGSLVAQFGPLPSERVVHFLRQACRSLAEAHEAGLLHRDIKPQNMFVCRLGLDYDALKVLDFGLVKWVGSDETQLTTENMLTGTPSTMPPERILNGPPDERSDLYSLGCAAYWLLTGRPVFAGDPMAMLLHHVRTEPAPPSTLTARPIPEGLERAVLSCLAKDPAGRPRSALDLWRQLSDVSLTEPWTSERAEQWWREHVPSVAAPTPPRDETDGISKRM